MNRSRQNRAVLALVAGIGLLLTNVSRAQESKANAKSAFPQFSMKEIDKSLGVGYAVLLLDMTGDGKDDILVVDTKRLLLYENPTWKRHVLLEGQTKPDNVCISAHDVDGDGKMDLALGAEWKPFNTLSGGTLQWLRQGKTLDDWTVHPIAEEPTMHRIRWVDIDGTGKPALIAVPLMGRGSTRQKNWMDGAPVRVLAFRIPKDPVNDRWPLEVLDESLHVVHNFWHVPAPTRKGMDLITASYEGVSRLSKTDGGWMRQHLGVGNQDSPESNRGASEIKQGKLADGSPYIATIEPWHGFQVVVYTPPEDGKGLWHRRVLDDQLKWGHAVWCADLDGDGGEELVIGVRDNKSNNPGEKYGVRIYKPTEGAWKKWDRLLVDEGGVAVEDLAAGDLNGDGKLDIVAVGRASHNVRIYMNEGKGR